MKALLTIAACVLPACALLTAAGLGHAEEGKGDADRHAVPTQVESATVTGTITQLDPAKKAFTLKEDGSGDSADYRAYFRDGKQGPRLEKIAQLKVGNHVVIAYTEAEGRRVLTIDDAKK